MNIEILTDQPATGSNAVSSLQLEFDRLRKTLEREQKKLRKFFTEMDRLCQTYADQVLPEIKNHHGMLKILLSRLIDLSTRKSLSQWHREELEDWIHELLDQIGQFDHLDARAAAELYSDLQQHHFGQRSQIPDPDPFEPFLDDEADNGPAPESRAKEDEAQQDFFGFDDIPEFEEPHDGDRVEGLSTPEPAIDDKWLKQLFRRAAQALHPDREQDPECRAHKEKQMTALLQARDDNDILSLLQLYQQHVSDTCLQVPESVFEALCDSVEAQLEKLDMEKLQYLYADPQRIRVHNLLYAGTRKKQQQNLDRLLKDIRLMGQQIPEAVQSLRNLNGLKQGLELRRESRYAMMLEQDVVFF